MCRYLIDDEKDAVSPNSRGTKVAPHYVLEVGPGKSREVRLRLTNKESAPAGDAFGRSFDTVFAQRKREADEFYDKITPTTLGPLQRVVSRQAYAGEPRRCALVQRGLFHCMLSPGDS